MKLIHRGAGYYSLYDLAKDPDEMNDINYRKDAMKPMLQAFDEMRARLKEIFVQPDPPETR